MNPETRTCSKCKSDKPIDQFAVSNDRKSGRASWCRPCHSEYSRSHRERHPEIHKNWGRKSYLKKKYGISVDDWNRMYDAQDGKCALCGVAAMADARGNRLHVDHCHKTGTVRALLCTLCNTALGAMRDDPSFMRRCADYVESFR